MSKQSKINENADKNILSIKEFESRLDYIINSFNKAAISYPLDGSKDTDFVFPEEVMNQKQ